LYKMKALMKKSWPVGLILFALTSTVFAAPAYDGLYIVDGHGLVRTVDNAPVITAGVDYGLDIVQDIELTATESGYVEGMYILRGDGDVAAYGGAPTYPVGQAILQPYFGWNIARDLEPAIDWTAGTYGQAGYYVMDGQGGVFAVGDPFSMPPYFKPYRNDVTVPLNQDHYPYWGWDIAVDMEVSVVYENTDRNKPRINGYYIVDGYGGVHWCLEDITQSNVLSQTPWSGMPQPYFGWDITRDMELTPSLSGYFLMDGRGVLHMVGDATLGFAPPDPVDPVRFPYGHLPWWGFDIARDLELVVDQDTGDIQGIVILDGYGGLHEIGTVGIQQHPPLYTYPSTSVYWDIAEDMEISAFFTYVTESVTP
jgi:hypothetical protein